MEDEVKKSGRQKRIESYNEMVAPIIDAALEVHKTLGSGFFEGVYGDALAMEFFDENIPYEKEKKIPIIYKHQTLQHCFVADFVCWGKIIVELKAIDTLLPIHSFQVMNYLKATGYKVGLVIDFGQESLVHKCIYNVK